MDVGIPEVEGFLGAGLGLDIGDVELVGVGAWTRCYGFRVVSDDFVVRLGDHVDDFEKDRRAHVYAGPDLPIPEVLDIGEALGGYYAISSCAPGSPLESCTKLEWGRLVEPLVALFESLRTATIPAASGWGPWDGEGRATHPGWRDFLLAVEDDGPERRTHGWRAKLRKSPTGDASFRWGYGLLDEVATDDVPRCLVHGDLINRNVHVGGGTITGVFDWGCAIYGDHLYDLAWFEFWAPWHECLDADVLRKALEAKWRSVGYVPTSEVDRMLACYLHIGLDHLAYNAHVGDWSTLAQVEARMRAMVSIW